MAHWVKVQNVTFTVEPDRATWKCSADGVYSASLAYETQFSARIRIPELEQSWKVKTEGKIRLFLWLLLQNRIWTADRLRSRGWTHIDKFSLCDQMFENEITCSSVVLPPRRFGHA
jgi:hypothetical protein